MSDPTPRRREDAFGERTKLLRTSDAPLTVFEDGLGLFEGVSGFVGDFTVFERRAPARSARRMTAGGPRPGPAGIRGVRPGRRDRDPHRNPAVGPPAERVGAQPRAAASDKAHLALLSGGSRDDRACHPAARDSTTPARGRRARRDRHRGRGGPVRPQPRQAAREARLRHGGVRDDRGDEAEAAAEGGEPAARGRPTATTTRASTSRRTTCARRTSGCGRSTRTTRSSSRPRSATGRCYLAQQKGLFFALDAKTGQGRLAQEPGPLRGVVAHDRQGASSTSPTCTRVVCAQDQAGADGFVVAWDADTGRERWRYKTAAGRVVAAAARNRLYVGSWDHGVHAINAKTGQPHLALPGGQPGEHLRGILEGRIFIGSDGGTLYSLSAKTGKLLWSARRSGAEFWYATPTVAYGRVYIGNTDGTMYVFGAKTRQPAVGAPARQLHLRRGGGLQRRKVFVGTYDGKFYALDAATGDVLLADRRARSGARGAHGHERASSTTRSARAAARRRSARWPAGPTPPTRCAPATARRCGNSRRRQVREPGGVRRRPAVRDRPRPRVRIRPKGSKVVKEYLKSAREKEETRAVTSRRTSSEAATGRRRPEASDRVPAARPRRAPGCRARCRRPTGIVRAADQQRGGARGGAAPRRCRIGRGEASARRRDRRGASRRRCRATCR